MSDTYLLTSISPQREHYGVTEAEAAQRAGFTVQQISITDVMNGNAPIKDANAFMRHYATEHWMFDKYSCDNNIVSAIPGYDQANDWFKFVPHDWQAFEWLKRNVGYVDVSTLYDDDMKLDEPIKQIVDHIFGDKKRMFAKSSVKRCMDSAVCVRDELSESLHYVIGIHSHQRLIDLIYSDPIKIAKVKTKYGRAEYRCLMVGGECSSISLFSDKKDRRYYTDATAFAVRFAKHFKDRLPLAYNLDIARLEDGDYAVIEINDIAACGFFIDNDIYKLFYDIYRIVTTHPVEQATE